ncbi:MAG: PHP domain-containing protein [Bacilli bacterium]|nr:PHP domain-containing protein [Bacilli bacterium]
MGKIKAEFHIHTRYSKDSILNKYFILLICKIKKIKLIAITDHNEIEGALKYKKFLKKFNIDVIVGEEIMTKKGEIIGLFLYEKIKPLLSIDETIKQIKKQNGIVYVPHPYDEKRYKTVIDKEELNHFKSKIDCIEIHNGRNIDEIFSEKQEQIQQKLNINPIIGSDAHTFIELGRNYIEIDYVDLNDLKKNFVQIIKTAKFNKKKCIKFTHTLTKFSRVIKMIEKGEFNELFRIIKRNGKKRK